jgi:Ca-activated chloride channel homolog
MQTDGKITQAKQAAEVFVQNMEPDNRVGLAVFSDEVRVLVPLDRVEVNLNQLIPTIRSLNANGGTELYQSLEQTITMMNAQNDENRIRAVVVLSDGEDTGDSGVTLNDAIRAITASRESMNPVIVIPVAYGLSADINALNSIARASATKVQEGDAANILSVLQIISSYF